MNPPDSLLLWIRINHLQQLNDVLMQKISVLEFQRKWNTAMSAVTRYVSMTDAAK